MADLNLMAEKIKTILAGVPGIMEAFDHEPQSLNNLPAATLYFDGFSQSEKTTRRATVNWQWTIRLYIPLNTSDVKEPQLIIRDFIKNTINQLRMDISLGGTCFFHTISNGEVFVFTEQNNPMYIAELTLAATTEEDM